MNRDNLHPDTELLDRLRAGLLDDEPTHKRRLETHLAACARCRQIYSWDGHLAPGALAPQAPLQRLERIRRRALGAPRHRMTRRFIPLAVAAAMALVAVLLVRPGLEPDAVDSRLARSEAREVPELYEELDFYLWLADHRETKDSRS